MPTIQIARRLSMVLLGMFVAVPTGAQLSLVKGTLSGSGGPSSGGAFTAHTTTSQPDAGEASGGPYDVTGGFAEGDPADCAALAAAASVTASETFCAASE